MISGVELADPLNAFEFDLVLTRYFRVESFANLTDGRIVTAESAEPAASQFTTCAWCARLVPARGA